MTRSRTLPRYPSASPLYVRGRRARGNSNHNGQQQQQRATALNPSGLLPARPLRPVPREQPPAMAAGPCRLCGDPAWQADDRGPVHRCCDRAETAGLTRCGPCAVSREARRRWEANHPVADGDDRAGGRT